MPDKAARPKWNGEALRRHREARGWKVDELADILGASAGLVYKWENSESMPKADWFAALLMLFDVPPIRFFTGLDDFQQRLSGRALASKPGTPVVVDEEPTAAVEYITNGADAAARRGATRESGTRSDATSSTPTSGSKHGRRSRKRRA